jgi:plasmid maintenance system antidote protein VapI
MWEVATTDEFDAWFASVGEDAQAEIIAKVELLSNMAKSFDELVKRTTTKKTRQRAATRTQELLGELLLSEIRELAGKSQSQVAEALGIKQPSLSKLEKQSDMQISTLRRIVNALGGELEVVARFPKGTVKLDQFNQASRSASR